MTRALVNPNTPRQWTLFIVFWIAVGYAASAAYQARKGHR